MPFHKIELFGHVVYSPDLSYHDLLAKEETVKASVQAILEKAGGEFIHFEAFGDMLQFQCVLTEESEAVFHAICDDLAPNTKNDLDVRILMVDKKLNTLYYYSIADGRWQEAYLGLPPAGYLAPKLDIMRPSTDHPRIPKKK